MIARHTSVLWSTRIGTFQSPAVHDPPDEESMSTWNGPSIPSLTTPMIVVVDVLV
jgi:hypothetical protein